MDGGGWVGIVATQSQTVVWGNRTTRYSLVTTVRKVNLMLFRRCKKQKQKKTQVPDSTVTGCDALLSPLSFSLASLLKQKAKLWNMTYRYQTGDEKVNK